MKLIGQPRPGVCDECGHAVVRSIKHPPRDGWQNGHFYQKFKLRKVRCEAHGGVFPIELSPFDVVVGPMIQEKMSRHARKDLPGLRFIGFWRSSYDPLLPDPSLYVDPSWDPAERAKVVAHLRSAPVVEHWMGSSTCCICNLRPLGSTDQCDGVYLWPSGFPHYVENHHVRPPKEFVAHVLGLSP